jgi:hypothetical protein
MCPSHQAMHHSGSWLGSRIDVQVTHICLDWRVLFHRPKKNMSIQALNTFVS